MRSNRRDVLNIKHSSKEDRRFKENIKTIAHFEVQSFLNPPVCHFGGTNSTRLLAESVQIGKGDHVLEVGCGTGGTACYLARRYGCQVMGVDIAKGMIENAKKRVRKESLGDKVRLVRADGRRLPFRDETFDCVIAEAATDWEINEMVKERARVTKQGGYVGIADSFWRGKPPKELVKRLYQAEGHVETLTLGEWRGALAEAGLAEIKIMDLNYNYRSEMVKIFLYYMLHLPQMLVSLASSPSTLWKFLLRKNYLHVMWEESEYFGWGVYVGRK